VRRSAPGSALRPELALLQESPCPCIFPRSRSPALSRQSGASSPPDPQARSTGKGGRELKVRVDGQLIFNSTSQMLNALWPVSAWPMCRRTWRSRIWLKDVSSGFLRIGARLFRGITSITRAAATLHPHSPCWLMRCATGVSAAGSASGEILRGALETAGRHGKRAREGDRVGAEPDHGGFEASKRHHRGHGAPPGNVFQNVGGILNFSQFLLFTLVQLRRINDNRN